MFHKPIHVAFTDVLSNRPTNMLIALALNQKMAFIAKKHFSPIGCNPVSVFFCPVKPFLFHVSKSCLFTGLLAIRPHSISRRRTVLELTFTPDDNKSFLSISLVLLGSFLLYRNILILSLVEVFLFLPHFSFLLGDNVPMVRACFNIRETVDWFTPTMLAILRWFFAVCSCRVSIFVRLRGVVSIMTFL